MPEGLTARAQQLALAVVFLTRLPVGRFLPERVLPLNCSLWAFPLAGALVGAISGAVLLLPGPALLTATLSVVTAVWLTGALHEDGLADFADAAGGRNRDDRLRIMRDSRIGSYGVTALLLTTMLRIVALSVLGPLALIAAATAGRAAIVAAMAILPPARNDGQGAAAGRAELRVVAWAAGLALLFAIPLGPWGTAVVVIAVGGMLHWVVRRARQMIGGQTGDVLGTVSLAVETAVLVALALLPQTTAH